MNNIIKEKVLKFNTPDEYSLTKEKLLKSLSICEFDDAACEIKYLTEEITPVNTDEERIKVLLLFKNPHPDSIDGGLFFSEAHSKLFWDRFFEVDCNQGLRSLLNSTDQIKKIADTMASGDYDCPFLYYFRCFYPFPSRQFTDLEKFFSRAPQTYEKEILERSGKELKAYIKQHDIGIIITFFKDAMDLLGGTAFAKSEDVIKNAKVGMKDALLQNDDSLFWRMNPNFKQEINDNIKVYLNMNTRLKNGKMTDNNNVKLEKRYFTYNLELILRDVLKLYGASSAPSVSPVGKK